MEEGQSAHSVLVEEVGQARMVAEKTAHPGLSHPALADVQVAQLLTPAGGNNKKVQYKVLHPPSGCKNKTTFLGTFCSLLDKNWSPRSEMLLPLTLRTLRQ